MERRTRLLAQLLAVALVLIAAVGVHSFSLQHRLNATVESFAALEQDRNLWKSKAEQAAGLADTASVSLNQCSAQVEDLKSLLAASTSPALEDSPL